MSMRRLTGNVAILAAAIAVGATSAMADYSRVEWIKGSGNAWIYTDYKPAATDKVVIKFKLAQVTSSNNEFLFCSRGTSTSANMFCGLRLGTSLRLDYGDGTANQKRISETPNMTDVYVMTLDGNAKKGWVETEGGTPLGTEVSWSSAVTPASTFVLFASHTLGSSLSASSTAFSNFSTSTLYSCKVYNSAGVMVRCWVPAVDDSVEGSAVGHFGVLDLCSDKFWPCRGTTPFTAGAKTLPGKGVNRAVSMADYALVNGTLSVDLAFARHGYPQRLFVVYGDTDCGATTNGWDHVVALAEVGANETSRTVSFSGEGVTARYLRYISQAAIPGAQPVAHLLSSGANEYIDTGFCPNGSSRADLSFAITARSASDSGEFVDPFGSRVGNTYQMHAVGNVSLDFDRWDARWGTCNSNGTGRNVIPIVGEHLFSYNCRAYNFDGKKTCTFADDWTFPSRTEYACYVFAVNNTGSAHYFAKMRLYTLDIWDEGEMVRSYTPCVKDDGTLAIYDAVNDTFTPQTGGATALTAGNVVWSATDAIDLAAVVSAEWKADAVDGDAANPANWVCRNALNAVVANGLPNETTTVRFTGTVRVQIPTNTVFACKAVVCDDVTLDGNCDWRGLGVSPRISGGVNLNGHSLDVAGLAPNCEMRDYAIPSAVGGKAMFWLDAADETTIEEDASGNVLSWASKAGDGRKAVPRNSSLKPVYNKSQYSRPCVDFGEFAWTGNGKDMKFGEFTNIRTAILVLKVDYKGFLLGSDTGKYIYFHRGSDGAYAHDGYSKVSQVWNGLDSKNPSADVLPSNSFEIVTVKMSEDSRANTLASDRYGIVNTGAYRMGGRQICEVILFGNGSEPTDAERIEIVQYLQKKWNTKDGGVLHVDVEDGAAAKDKVHSFGPGRLVKDGAGSLTFPAVQFADGVDVNGGTLNALGSSTSGRVSVAEGATVSGLTLLDGATLDIGDRTSVLPAGVTFAADAVVTVDVGSRQFKRNNGEGEKIVAWSSAPSGVTFTRAGTGGKCKFVAAGDGLYAVGSAGFTLIVR